MNIKKESTIFSHSAELGRYYVAIQNEFFQKYITSSMGIFHDCFIATIDDNFTNITLLGSSIVTDSFQTLCDRQEFGATITDSVRSPGIESLRDGFSDMKNLSEGVGSSSPYRIYSPYISSINIKILHNTFRL